MDQERFAQHCTLMRAYVQSHRARWLRELQEFVRIPSVSAQPQYATAVRRCASWLAAYLRRIGLEQVMVVPTPRHPIVYAEWCHAADRPTVLIYGHYDVQPIDPLDAWRTAPFEPTLRGECLYGRGTSDDKGPLFCHVAALESYLQTTGRLPVNVICIFEGEEEIGSPHLAAFLKRHRTLLTADVAAASDTRFLAAGRPAITYALRGRLGFTIDVQGQQADVHSGSYGGALHNPIQALCEIIARLHTADGRIAIPGFYDRVRRLGVAKRAQLRRRGPTDAQILRHARATSAWGEPGYSLYERTTIRPALTINGIRGGYQGPGGKGVIPSRASAKVSLRLVPDQDPQEIEWLVRQQIARLAPPTMQVAMRTARATRPVLLNRRHPAFQAAARAYQQGFGAAPVFVRSGGSIPVVGMVQELLGLSMVLMGFALPDDRMHAPNERFRLSQFDGGIATCISFLAEMGEHDRQLREHADPIRRRESR